MNKALLNLLIFIYLFKVWNKWTSYRCD